MSTGHSWSGMCLLQKAFLHRQNIGTTPSFFLQLWWAHRFFLAMMRGERLRIQILKKSVVGSECGEYMMAQLRRHQEGVVCEDAQHPRIGDVLGGCANVIGYNADGSCRFQVLVLGGDGGVVWAHTPPGTYWGSAGIQGYHRLKKEYS